MCLLLACSSQSAGGYRDINDIMIMTNVSTNIGTERADAMNTLLKLFGAYPGRCFVAFCSLGSSFFARTPQFLDGGTSLVLTKPRE